jgi:hypothetical protein
LRALTGIVHAAMQEERAQVWTTIDSQDPAAVVRVVSAFVHAVRPRDPVELAVASGEISEAEAGETLINWLREDPALLARWDDLPDIVVHEGAVPPGAILAEEPLLHGLRDDLAPFAAVTPVRDNAAWASAWRPEPGFAALAVDNVSSDGTPELLRAKGVRVIEQPAPVSRVRNWHAAMEAFRDHSDRPWMKWVFAGDELLPGAADVLEDALAAHPEARLVVAECIIRNPDGTTWHWRQLPETRIVAPAEALELSAMRGNWFGGPIHHMVHRDVLDEVEFGAQPWVADWQACLSIARNHPVLYVAEPIGVFDIGSRKYFSARGARVDSLVQELSIRLQSLDTLREIAPERDISQLEHDLQAHAAQALSERVAQEAEGRWARWEGQPVIVRDRTPPEPAEPSAPAIAIHCPRLPADVSRDFMGYEPLFAERHARYAYIPQLADHARVREAAANEQVLRLEQAGLEVITDAAALNQVADVLVSLRGNAFAWELAPPAAFTGLKAYHVFEFVFYARQAHEALVAGGVDVGLGYARHDEYSPFFRELYPSLTGRMVAVPFGYGERFAPTVPFGERERKVVGLGSVNPVNDPLCPPGMLDDYVGFYAEEQWSHAWRRALVEHAAELEDVLVPHFPVFPETKDWNYDAVAMLNAHAMFVNDIGLMAFPPARTYEGPAAGALLVGADSPVHRDLGFAHGENALLHRNGDVEDFARVVREAIAEPERLAAMAAAGTAMVRERYSHAAIADQLYAELRARLRAG